MKLAAFNAVCPFEIGDKIGMRKNACAVSGRTLDVIVERTITDIVCMHSVKAGTVKFLYELDNSGKLVVIAAAEERRAQKMIHAICDFCGKDCDRTATLLTLQPFQNFARYHTDNKPFGTEDKARSFVICSECGKKARVCRTRMKRTAE